MLPTSLFARLAATACLAALGACSRSSAPAPLNAADHERAASSHLDVAEREAARFDPAQRPSLPCPGIGLTRGDACIRRTNNPTEVHLDVAATERRIADEHRNAAARLLDEERAACRGLTDRDRDEGPFGVWKQHFSAQPLVDYDEPSRYLGTVVDFPGEPPDADRLQVLVACHRAHVAGRGLEAGAHECPLDDLSLAVLVIATPRGTLLDLRSEDPAAARRAWERARRAATASRRARATPAAAAPP